MKKHGIGSRLLALLLVLALILPVLPTGVFAAVGDIATDEKVGDTGLEGDIDPTDTISWPIKVYDFLNDGMLFEFANANDATYDISDTLGGAYGGGTPAPQFAGAATVIGTDYTVNWGYEKYAYTTWLQTYSAFKYSDSLVEAVNFVSPSHLHLVPKGTYTDMKPWIMSDYYNDNSTTYTPDAVRYAVVVYRTSGLEAGEAKLNLGWETNLVGSNTYSGYTSVNYDYRGSVDLVANSDKWNYVVIDMNAGTLGSKWSTITKVYRVIADFQMNEPTDSVDISHVAYFDTEFEAIEFGKDAVAFDNDPGEFLDAHTEYTDGTEVAVSRPSTGDNNGMDFSVANKTTGGYAMATYKTWSATPSYYKYLGYSVGGVKTTPVGTDERSYVSITNSHNTTDRSIFVWNYSGGGKLYYVTLVYKTTGFTSDQKIGFYTRSSNGGGSNMATTLSGATKSTTLPMSNDEWTTVTYAIADFNDGDYNSSTAYTQYGMYLPSCLTGSANAGKSLDIAMVWMNTNRAVATAYGKQAADYMNGKTEIVTGSYQTAQKKWNTGSNVAFGMLFSNYGGGWNYSDSTNGGTNSWANGYYSYQIGQTVTTNPSNAQNVQRTEAAQKSYPVSDSIFLLNQDAAGMSVPYATDDLDFGYKLINTLTSGLYTAGLLESGLITVTDKNGNSYRVPNYKEKTVEYIAQMLRDALSIGQTDTSGNYNYNFVKGTANGAQYGYDNGKALDLASALRKRLNVVLPENGGNCTSGRAELGTYTDTAAKKSSLIGSFADCKDSITTFMDAAYYLLHNLYVDDSYNQTQNDYDYLVLSSASVEQSDGTTKSAYVFDGGFTTGNASDTANTDTYRASSESAVKYDTTARTISLTSAASKDQVYFQGTHTTSRFPFLPITDSEGIYAGETKSPYFLDDGRGVMGVTEEGATFVNRNYNYAIAANGEFVYYAEDGLFFEFEGDDDVYLFINGELVLDIGAAHSVTNVSMNLNDYVAWAQTVLANPGNYTEAVVARAEKLNLQDGESYAFDFYYMERHGWGANCRIVSNIRVTDPAMKTEKTAYQDDVEVSYGSIVNTEAPIEYGFTITNNGNSKLYHLSFEDKDIGVTLDSTNGLTVAGSNACDLSGSKLDCTDLVAYVSGLKDGVETTIKVTFANQQALKDFLATLAGEGLESGESSGDTTAGDGLWIGCSVTIRGIGYQMTEAQQEAGKFDNTVHTTANSLRDGTGKTLHGKDNHLVYKAAEPMYYQWAGHALTVSIDRLRDDVVDAAKKTGNALSGQIGSLDKETEISSFELCLRNGTAWSYTEITKSGSNLVIQYQNVGSNVFYVKLYYGTNATLVVPVLVNVTDVKDQVYVLDYGLKATTDLFKGATLTVPARETEYQIMGLTGTVDSDANAQTPSYLAGANDVNKNRISFTSAVDDFSSYAYNPDGDGYTDMTYSIADGKVTFTPGDFMDDVYNLWTAVTVCDKNLSAPTKLGGIDINNEVQMYQKTTVLPATVVYYEDDFPALEYFKSNTTNTFTTVGGSGSYSQSVDNDENYGHDATYADGNNTDKSAGTLTTIVIKQDGPVAKFTFKGTGFELISRTNATDSAIIELAVFSGAVNVTYDSETGQYKDSNGTVVTPIRYIPVITEFDNGGNGGEEAIYQVPVVRVDDLTHGTYTVVIAGVPARDFTDWDGNGEPPIVPTNLYIDGLRIFQPLGATNENYNANENGATFQEIRDLIVEGTAAVVSYTDTDGLTLGSGTVTWTENRNGATYTTPDTEWKGNQVSSVNDYLTLGPNNEVYMNGTFEYAALVFYVTENTDSTVHNLQLAVHAVDLGLFTGTSSTGMNAQLYYGVLQGDKYVWEPLVTVTSGTEQYYTIPYDQCPEVDGKYQIVIMVDSGMISYTSLKYNGLTISTVNGTGEAATLRYNNGLLEKWDGGNWVPVTNAETYANFQSLSEQMASDVIAPETPEIQEPTEEPGEEPGEPEKPSEGEAPSEPVAPSEPAELPFVDVAETDWFHDAVEYVYLKELMVGMDDAHFGAKSNLTRAQLVTILYRMAGSPEVEGTTTFEDVKAGSWYADAVLWASNEGIAYGYSDTEFRPNEAVSREQTVSFIARYAATKGVDVTPKGDLSGYTDAGQVSGWAEDAMIWAVENGVVHGMGDGTLAPKYTTNRAQAAQLIAMLHEKLK